MSDLISRQAAIDALDKRFDNVPIELTTEILQLRRDLRELPSAQPERKEGKWLHKWSGDGSPARGGVQMGSGLNPDMRCEEHGLQ